MEQKYEVTIGIPVYNAEKYIRQAMNSALAQTFERIEFLIVDDCGTDSSISIVKELQHNHPRGKDIHILCQKENKGVSAARNRIIDEAQGRYLYFMDADDLIESETLSILMSHQCRTGADIVYGSYDKIESYHDHQILETIQYPYLELNGEGLLAEYAWCKYRGVQTTIWNYVVDVEMLRRSKIRFIDTNFWEDMAFTFELLPCCRHAVLLPDITYHYLCRYDSLSNYQEREQISKEEVLRNISTVDYMKRQCAKTMNKKYEPERCQHVLMTDFYMLSYILRNSQRIVPSFSKMELKAMMSHPARLSEILGFKHGRVKHVLLYMLAKLPAIIIVWLINFIGRAKGLI